MLRGSGEDGGDRDQQEATDDCRPEEADARSCLRRLAGRGALGHLPGDEGPGAVRAQPDERDQHGVLAIVAREPAALPFFHPTTGEVRSDGADGIACWFIDIDYNEESFFVRHAYFLGGNDPCKALRTTLKAEIDADAWATLHSDVLRPFDRPGSGRIAVKVINHLGDEVMKVFRV